MTVPLPGLPSRRDTLQWAAAGALTGFSAGALADDFANALRKGGVVVLLRHSTTTAGVGDPPEFRLDQCKTQRNLSPEGIALAQKIGTWFRQQQLKPAAVKSSAWCRCIDTANLAFGSHTLWSPLNSTFGDRLPIPDQTAEIKRALGRVAKDKFEVWVSHGNNILALTGERPAMGEAFLMNADAAVVARKVF